MKKRIELSKEEIEAMFKKKPSLLGAIMTVLFGIWTVVFTATVFAVLTKLIVLAWMWLV